jgi:tetratricopeptide (TPR) repeat protein
MKTLKLNRSAYPVYAKFIQDFLNKEKSFYLYKSCPDLGVTEKRLLKARKLLRQGEFHEMLSVLNEIKTNQVVFFEAEVNILKSQAYAFLLDFQNAIIFNLKANSLYREVDDQFGIFISLYNLSVDYARLNLDILSLHFLELARLEAHEPNQKGLILRADACRYAKEKNETKAIESLQNLEAILDQLNEFDRMNSLTVMSSVFTEIGRYEDALKQLESVENRTFFETKNKLQMDFALLRYLVKDETIPSPQIKPEQNLLLYLQWKLLYLLSSGQIQMAKEVWTELGSVDPLFKNSGFCEYSVNDIFGKVLAKIYKPKVLEQSELKGKLHDLYAVLQESPLPLSKEELIERVWGIKYQEGFDDRLYKAIARLRKDFKVRIISKASSYSLAS